MALIGEGTYPVVKGGVSTWCDQLVTGLPDHDFAVVTLVGADRERRWTTPSNVRSVSLIPMWDPAPRAPLSGRRRENRRVGAALHSLWTAALPGGVGTEADLVRQATESLQELARPGRHRLAATLARASSAQPVLAAWNAHRADNPTAASLPALTLADAAQVSRLADRILAVLDARWPEVDLMHVASNGPASLIALARKWRDGTPLLLTEHGIYLRERYLALSDLALSWPVRYALMSLTRLICQVTYAEAVALAPVSDFNARWERRLGADPARVSTVHNGVDTEKYAPLSDEPPVPTVSFVGRIDPLKDLATMIDAFAIVHRTLPNALLRLFGPVPDQNAAYHAELQAQVARLGLAGVVTFEGSVPGAQIAAAAGHVVALSSISEGLPFTVIESMMCGRATVSTDVGGVGEVTGRDGVAGVVVPPRDPQSLADALVGLLVDDDRRRAMGRAARDRALRMFSLELFHTRIRGLYGDALAGPATRAVLEPVLEPAGNLVEPVPSAPSTAPPMAASIIVDLTQIPVPVTLTVPPATQRSSWRQVIDLREASERSIDNDTLQVVLGDGSTGARCGELLGSATGQS